MTKGKIVLPQFIIAGGMKCGTSSLHHILACHPDIFIPDREIYFYDMDDILQHKDFFFYEENKWWYPDFETDAHKYLKWYSNFFEEAPDNNMLGEDSTTYLASDIAAKRISEINPSAKIIVMLRNPTSRSYSHYWHLFRTGRTTKAFEECIKNQETLISRSLYKKHVVNLTNYISINRIKFISFENFIENMDQVVNDVLSFLGVDKGSFSLENIDTHKNKSIVPLSIRGQLFRNKLLKNESKLKYRKHLPYSTPPFNFTDNFLTKSIIKIHQIINPQTGRKIPDMKEETKDFLNNYFRIRNEGINELTGFEIDKNWYK